MLRLSLCWKVKKVGQWMYYSLGLKVKFVDKDLEIDKVLYLNCDYLYTWPLIKSIGLRRIIWVGQVPETFFFCLMWIKIGGGDWRSDIRILFKRVKLVYCYVQFCWISRVWDVFQFHCYKSLKKVMLVAALMSLIY